MKRELHVAHGFRAQAKAIAGAMHQVGVF
jgi:hypothetical protein